MNQREENGLILIPDISGYTAFVHQAHAEHAQTVVSRLLESLIDAEQLGLDLCDIEGDALFFFRRGPLPDFESIIGQVVVWYSEFHRIRRNLRLQAECGCGACEQLDSRMLRMGLVDKCGVTGNVRHQNQSIVFALGHFTILPPFHCRPLYSSSHPLKHCCKNRSSSWTWGSPVSGMVREF